MSNFSGGMGSGLALGYVIGSQNQRRRDRKLSQIGSDQLLLKVKASKHNVGKALANLYSNWEYQNEALIRTKELRFDFLNFIMSALVVAVILFVIWVITETEGLTFWGSTLIISIPSIVIGYLSYDNAVESITLGESDGYTLVLVKVYDSEGYRNYNEIELDKIINTLEDLYAGEEEVRANLGEDKNEYMETEKSC